MFRLAPDKLKHQAQAQKPVSKMTELKQGATFTSTVVGTIVGGPVGFSRRIERRYLGDQIKKAEEVDTMSDSLAAANNKIEELTASCWRARMISRQN